MLGFTTVFEICVEYRKNLLKNEDLLVFSSFNAYSSDDLARRDFTEGHIVIVDGWILSKSEIQSSANYIEYAHRFD